jgi:hypothetical protein
VDAVFQWRVVNRLGLIWAVVTFSQGRLQASCDRITDVHSGPSGKLHPWLGRHLLMQRRAAAGQFLVATTSTAAADSATTSTRSTIGKALLVGSESQSRRRERGDRWVCSP